MLIDMEKYGTTGVEERRPIHALSYENIKLSKLFAK